MPLIPGARREGFYRELSKPDSKEPLRAHREKKLLLKLHGVKTRRRCVWREIDKKTKDE